ncbi:MAG: alpha/beta hydrolase-fold protein [Proteobacteria bacterium]|nr:alpha/beta hydrolase-fold protein [Pseudomonadota bacterium]
MQSRSLFSCLVLVTTVAACGDDAPSTTLTCGTGTEGTLAVGTPVVVTDGSGADLRGAAIAAQAKTTLPASSVTIACSEDIVPAGYVALGPAVTFGAEGTWSDRAFELTLPYKAARLPTGAGRRHVRIVARRGGTPEAFFPPVANRVLDDKNPYASTATFRAGELTTYQVVAEATAGQPETQQFGFNAIVGISMGGNAAMTMALKHPDRFDAFADLGGEPGPSMIYSLSMVRDFLFGGFCTAADEAAGKGLVGQLCPNATTRADQYEITADYEHMITQDGDGVGLTLQRSLYMKASRDLARALSNPALFNKDNAYAPPGVPASYFAMDVATRCANPIQLADFFDREFNPTGQKPVITYCDGGDGTALGLGVFDPSKPQDDPAEILLAVDLNANGKRDPGEPVITDAFEPYQDVGTDGKADADEPGYDAVTNPDPAHDDYHYQRNPRGTERNGTHDPGEPFEDVGLDGVAGTCQQGATPSGGVAGCYDYGEGNGTWDLSPNVARWYENDVNVRLAAMTPAQRRHVGMGFDAGVRDFLNAAVSANAGVGGAMAQFDAPFGVYDGFAVLANGKSETTYDWSEVTWSDLPRNGYVRYGNPDATAAEIANGDGKHVGTPVQIIARAETAFAYLDKQFPGGDRSDTLDSGRKEDLTFTSPTTGRVSPFGLYLPPGYDKPENAGVRYPVIYFLHGYGQEPADLVALADVFTNFMLPNYPLTSRFQKFIIVFVDGRCRPQHDGVPVPTDGDACERGTFYTDAPLGGTARMETNLIDLMDHIDATYRTKQAAAVEVTP